MRSFNESFKLFFHSFIFKIIETNRSFMLETHQEQKLILHGCNKGVSTLVLLFLIRFPRKWKITIVLLTDLTWVKVETYQAVRPMKIDIMFLVSAWNAWKFSLFINFERKTWQNWDHMRAMYNSRNLKFWSVFNFARPFISPKVSARRVLWLWSLEGHVLSLVFIWLLTIAGSLKILPAIVSDYMEALFAIVSNRQRLHAFFFIRTSKFWPCLIVLKFLHSLSLNCS